MADACDEPRSLRQEAAAEMRRLSIRPRKHLGQNFLVESSFVERIVAAGAPEGETVLEIGPGLGALSGALATRAKRVVLIEIDGVLAERLEKRFAGSARVQVLRGDALEIDFDVCGLAPGRAVVVANLPYSVGSQIVLRLFEERRRFSRLVLMLQREVASRLTAAPGTADYGILSVWRGLYAEGERLFTVPPGAFLPRPKVESAVIRLSLLDEPRVAVRDLERLRRVVRASFGQRRKMLRRSLAGIVSPESFERAGIDSSRRGETLSVEEFVRLADSGVDAGR